MTDNPSFVLRGVEDVVFEQRPIPEGRYLPCECKMLDDLESPQFLAQRSLLK